jgi:hypothetical protein
LEALTSAICDKEPGETHKIQFRIDYWNQPSKRVFAMTISKYQQARKLIEEAGGGGFEGPKSELLVAKAEAALGVKFPPSYRAFLLEMGCGDINGLEILGLIDGNFQSSSVPNGIWLTLNERRVAGFNQAYVIIGEGGDGTYLGIDTMQVDEMGECPIIRLSTDGKRIKQVADSFGQYLLDSIRAVT